MTPDRPTFSPLWHRVRALRPRLRPHVQVTRQHYRGRRWHIVHDPASNQFYRLSPVAYQMVGLLDGNRTVEEVWNIALSNHGDAAPTQQETIELLGQLHNTNLLSLDASPETEQLLSRGRERTKRKITQQAIGIMYFKVRLLNPGRYLDFVEPLLRPLLNRVGLVLWAAWVLYALFAVVVPHWDELASSAAGAMAPANYFWIGVVFIVIKLIHETGHGVLCRRFGGQVPEFGIMLLVLFPSPYVDASSAWSFPSKWKRIAVGGGGMIFELAVAAGAALLWKATLNDAGSLAHQLAYNAMFTASITTIFFNANPLMRFDGYYMLSDLLEVPNLMQRSMKMLQYLAQKYLYRLEQAKAPSTSRAEQAILVVYGIAAMIYRVFLFFGITLYIMGRLFALGLILAVWTAAAWFLIPLGKFAHWLAASPQHAEHRLRAVATSVAVALVGLIVLGVIPMPDHRRAAGVVESAQRSGIFFGSDGFVTAVHKRLGDRVGKGELILECRNPDLEMHLARARGQLAEFESIERMYTARNAAGAQIARDRIAAVRDLIRLIQDRIDALEVRAPHEGVLVSGVGGIDPGMVLGAFAKRGQMICEVVDTEHTRITAPLTTAQAAPLIELSPQRYRVEVRPLSEPHRLLAGSGVAIIDAGQRVLPHPALGYQGGGTIETESQDKMGLLAKTPQFIARIDRAEDGKLAWLGDPGERVRIRFTLPPRPLLGQWMDRLSRLLQGRAQL
jgi:putative peptide zinc metalloprotease protein